MDREIFQSHGASGYGLSMTYLSTWMDFQLFDGNLVGKYIAIHMDPMDPGWISGILGTWIMFFPLDGRS